MPLSTLRVLILEDQPVQRRYAVTLLAHLGCTRILEASDGWEALQLLESNGPVDIAFCDICMEGMDGITFLRRASQRHALKSVVITSSIALDVRQAISHMATLLGLRVLGQLCKPLHEHELKRLAGKYLDDDSHPACPLHVAGETNEHQVLSALENGELEVFYQPKFDIRTLQVTSVEALARWNHPERGILAPASFIPVLERHGLMDSLLYRQIDHCLTLRKQALASEVSLTFAVNVNASQFANPQMSAHVALLLKRFDAPGSSLSFEMTETGTLDPGSISLENMVRLRMMGCGLSIDDFGGGYSSLQRLCSLPFNEIKIQAEFIRDLSSEPRSRAAISSVLSLARELNIGVVIEGIETVEQRDILITLGCETGQGYLLARPMPAHTLLPWLIGRNAITQRLG
ncbi:EAL domain-containing protein [Pseudomonas sp. Larv2_ips]|uniref:EAL domain-containing response regulator n=1 Tax=Pseudomonas sp. Larv2_ips TaxID=1896942 RepID=UPI000E6C2F04|nr:EAL domain-containing response regulator [Pseudomonas sp. Larv2_ips]